MKQLKYYLWTDLPYRLKKPVTVSLNHQKDTLNKLDSFSWELRQPAFKQPLFYVSVALGMQLQILRQGLRPVPGYSGDGITDHIQGARGYL